ncbi:hypothetical protein [Lysobacter sp. BMK333-48F3]|nr:hypothetical protein [Lysobacter sp. BMK333-48F3]
MLYTDACLADLPDTTLNYIEAELANNETSSNPELHGGRRCAK